MRASFVWRTISGFSSALAILIASGAPLAAQEDARPAHVKQAERGKVLFERKWAAHDSLTPSGDGLGPMRNAESCVACHLQGAIGGGGPNDKNVQLLTVDLSAAPQDVRITASRRPRSSTSTTQKKEDLSPEDILAAQLLRVNSNFLFPSMKITPSVVLHRFGGDERYAAWRESLWGVPVNLTGADRERTTALMHERYDRLGVTRLPKTGETKFLVSERNTPALFGAYLIDSISMQALSAIAYEQSAGNAGISGRVPPAIRNVGRFGWRGQTATLRDFVMGACAIELGLSTPANQQLPDPRLQFSMGTPPTTSDLSQELCNELIAYVESLPAPQQELPEEHVQIEIVNGGHAAFNTIGCADCHRQTIEHVVGLYSDLLLHDMGESLSDPVPGASESFAATYYGGAAPSIFAAIPAERLQEWRTPPLWGVADSAPYLHDGRADTLERAILLHGGEAKKSADRFRDLPRSGQLQILAFLGTLRAPRVADSRPADAQARQDASASFSRQFPFSATTPTR